MAAHQNLPGSAVVRQIVFVGVRRRLENIEMCVMVLFHSFLPVTVTRPGGPDSVC